MGTTPHCLPVTSHDVRVMNPHQQGSSEDVANHLLKELKIVVEALQAKLTHATKQDLNEMEARLIHAIQAGGVGEADLAGLNALLVRGNDIAARLTALDAQTQR